MGDREMSGRASCRECGEMRYLVAGDLCPSCAATVKRQQEADARWERIERSAIAILAAEIASDTYYDPDNDEVTLEASAVTWAIRLVDELDRRRTQ